MYSASRVLLDLVPIHIGQYVHTPYTHGVELVFYLLIN